MSSSSYTTNFRPFRVQRETGYKINNISLVKSYIVQVANTKQKQPIFLLNINGVLLEPTSRSASEVIWDFEQIRNELREILPCSEEENQKVALETMLTYVALCAQNAYKQLPTEVFNKAVFNTKELDIRIKTTSKDPFIDMEEEYFTSDIHQNTTPQ